MESNFMLTTIDNPYSPVTNFEKWLQFDNEKGYGTCQLLARITKTSDLLSDEQNQEAIEQAIDYILENDPENKYIKVNK